MKEYVCECGRVFTEPNKFNGHKSNCRIHHKAKGTLEQHEQKILKTIAAGELARQHSSDKAKLKRQQELEQWISEQHTCERCGKVMTEKFGSGRFCCRACANSHDRTEESKKKTSESIRSSEKCLKDQQNRKELASERYQRNPNYCRVCGKILPQKLKYKVTCSPNCYSILRRDIRIDTMEKLGSNCTKYYFGFYRGIECDSSWELAFLLYNLDNEQNIKRNKSAFPYIDKEGKERKYYPDFIVDGVFYEIKGFYDEDTYLKINSFPKDKSLVVIDKSNITKYLNYVITTYGEDFYTLYDSDRRSWKNLLT